MVGQINGTKPHLIDYLKPAQIELLPYCYCVFVVGFISVFYSYTRCNVCFSPRSRDYFHFLAALIWIEIYVTDPTKRGSCFAPLGSNSTIACAVCGTGDLWHPARVGLGGGSLLSQVRYN